MIRERAAMMRERWARTRVCRALYVRKGLWNCLYFENSEKSEENSKLEAALLFYGIQELEKKKKELAT